MDVTLFKSLARDWEDHGDADPFFGVLSDPAMRGGKWDAEAFFESGRRHVRSLMASLRDAGIATSRGACLDFGCGVGRLTQPFCEFFETVTGVDVAASMVRRARRHNAHGKRCRFVVNASPDLGQFGDGAFDFVHSSIVLQHMPPSMAMRYVSEFFRVASRDAVVVFQVPDSLRPAELSAAALALPAAGYQTAISLAGPLPALRAGERAEMLVQVRNASPIAWRPAPPTPEAGHIRLANHWLTPAGEVVVRDDGRGLFDHDVQAGEIADVSIVVRAPAEPGSYLLEFDLVQELVTWFADKGASTLRVPVRVETAPGPDSIGTPSPRRVPEPHAEPVAKVRTTTRDGVLARLFRRRPTTTAKPTFPMHVLPRAEVERAVASDGWRVARAFEDEACGPGWVSYTYVCVKGA